MRNRPRPTLDLPCINLDAQLAEVDDLLAWDGRAMLEMLGSNWDVDTLAIKKPAPPWDGEAMLKMLEANWDDN